ncbi:hypothetical protein V1511DRAFT_510787 [Dipodascopsis uninucleata]
MRTSIFNVVFITVLFECASAQFGGIGRIIFNPPPQNDISVPLPTWLRDLTGRTSWPSMQPPFIRSAAPSLSGISGSRYSQSSACSHMDECPFDCIKCLGPSDIMHCNQLLQTFDDGPIADTARLLSYLKTQNQKTTFFTIGLNVIANPDVFRTQHQDGHMLASHTYTHAYLPSLTNEQIAAEFQWSIWAMNATAGIVPRFYRPPFGGINNRVRAIAEKFGLSAVVWELDTNDWQIVESGYSRTASQVYSDVRSWKNRSLTGIILEHDLALQTVNVGIEVQKILGRQNGVAADCKAPGTPWYQ